MSVLASFKQQFIHPAFFPFWRPFQGCNTCSHQAGRQGKRVKDGVGGSVSNACKWCVPFHSPPLLEPTHVATPTCQGGCDMEPSYGLKHRKIQVWGRAGQSATPAIYQGFLHRYSHQNSEVPRDKQINRTESRARKLTYTRMECLSMTVTASQISGEVGHFVIYGAGTIGHLSGSQYNKIHMEGHM